MFFFLCVFVCINFLFFCFFFFFFNDTATTEIYTLSLHDALRPLSPRFPPSNTRRTCAVDGLGCYGCRGSAAGWVRPVGLGRHTRRSPAGLGHTGELATVGHLPQADPAQAELAVDRVRTTAALAARVAADRELRLLVRLVDKGSLGHAQFS